MLTNAGKGRKDGDEKKQPVEGERERDEIQELGYFQARSYTS